MNSRPAYRRAISMRSSRPWMRLSAGSTNRPETPYIGTPRLRRKRLSVAPVLIDGTTGTPGNLSSVRPSMTFITSGRSGEGGLASGGLLALTSTFGQVEHAAAAGGPGDGAESAAACRQGVQNQRRRLRNVDDAAAGSRDA